MTSPSPTPTGKAATMSAPSYSYLVDSNAGNRGRLYDGPDAADAMAAFSKAISDGVEYVTLEALRLTGKGASR